MTLAEINAIEDKTERLKLLESFIEQLLREQRDDDELRADANMNASRDEAFGMMSRFGKPSDD
jgi:hypothetical protein